MHVAYCMIMGLTEDLLRSTPNLRHRSGRVPAELPHFTWVWRVASGVGPHSHSHSLRKLLPHLRPGQAYTAVVKRVGFEVREAWVKPLVFSTSCVGLDELLNLSNLRVFIREAGTGAVPTSLVVVRIEWDDTKGRCAKDVLVSSVANNYLWCLGRVFPTQIPFLCLTFPCCWL